MQPLVFYDPAAEIIFWGSLALLIAIECVVRVRTDSQGRTSREWTLSLVVFSLVASMLVAGIVARHKLAPLPGPTWWPVAAGVALLWTGVAFRLWAVNTLGRFFKVVVIIQDDHRVVDRGPYRWIRHPSYTGGMITAIGIGLAYADWLSIAIMAVFPLIALLVRIRVEERMLLQELGEEYAVYAQRTARLLPGVF